MCAGARLAPRPVVFERLSASRGRGAAGTAIARKRLDIRLDTRLDLEIGVRPAAREESDMVLAAIVVLLVLALGAVPAWPYSREWGYYPSSALTVALFIVVALVLTGRL